MPRIPLSVVVLLMLALPGVRATAQMSGYDSNPRFDTRAKNVSILQLIANPQAYDGKRVRLIGFLRLEFEGNALYLHREDFEHAISNDALWVDPPRDMTKEQRQSVNNQYVICEATFRASGHGHMGLFSGELAEVTRLEFWSPGVSISPR
ncbi:MAG: hypothetical protein ACR2JE_00910 [Acidobacteriaceae bacterium]